jgi:hypothetical protein
MLTIAPLNLVNIVYSGFLESSSSLHLDSEISLMAAPSGSQYKSGKNESYTIRMLRSDLRRIRTKARSKNPLDYQFMSLLYRSGLCFPRDETLSALWAEMPPHGAVKLPNEELIYHKDLVTIASRSLKALFESSLLYAYPPDMITHYQKILAAFDSGCNVVLMYRLTKDSVAKLTQAIYLDNGKFVDCTAPVRLIETIAPLVLEDSMFTSFSSARFVVAGNLQINGAELLGDDLTKFLYIEDASDIPLSVNLESKAFVDKYRETYRKAQDFVRNNRRASATKDKANKLIEAFVHHETTYRRSMSKSRTEYKSSLRFVARGFGKAVSRIGKLFKSGNVVSVPTAPAASIATKLTELGFDYDTKKTPGWKRKRKA